MTVQRFLALEDNCLCRENSIEMSSLMESAEFQVFWLGYYYETSKNITDTSLMREDESIVGC